MKRILITGAGSYIGTSLERWLSKPQFAGMYRVDTVDMREDGWKKKDFSGYDTVFHVAGIVHRKETKENTHLYYEINRNLAIETAEKAKREGVEQFILMSTMSVYGRMTGVITQNTVPKPKTCYGKTKLEADTVIERMSGEKFHVAIIRPPMVYGKNCKGNYPSLSKFAKQSAFFPRIKNQRSMIYIGNLAEFIKKVIDEEKQGIFFPQNRDYVCTSQLVNNIARCHGHRIFFLRGFNSIIKILRVGMVQKVFGSLIYDISEDRCDTFSFFESIRRTEL